jgi:hypothetical protein
MQRNAGGSSRPQRDLTVDKLEQLPKRQSSTYHPEANKGEIIVYQTDQGWEREFLGDPNVFLAKVDPSKLTRVYAKYNSGIATDGSRGCRCSSDGAERAATRPARWPDLDDQGPAPIAGIEQYRIAGRGCVALLKAVEEYRNPLPVLAMALGIAEKKSVDELDAIQADALATGLVAARAGFLKVPEWKDVRWNLYYKSR